MLAAFVSDGSWYGEGYRYVCTFRVGMQQPVHQLQLDPTPNPENDLVLHQWSPDREQLAVSWNYRNGDCCYMALLSLRSATVEREASLLLVVEACRHASCIDHQYAAHNRVYAQPAVQPVQLLQSPSCLLHVLG